MLNRQQKVYEPGRAAAGQSLLARRRRHQQLLAVPAERHPVERNTHSALPSLYIER